jgi:hypothetical protein
MLADNIVYHMSSLETQNSCRKAGLSLHVSGSLGWRVEERGGGEGT